MAAPASTACRLYFCERRTKEDIVKFRGFPDSPFKLLRVVYSKFIDGPLHGQHIQASHMPSLVHGRLLTSCSSASASFICAWGVQKL